jgi:hypothetical protein
MGEQLARGVTEADIAAFAVRLDSWRQTLSPLDQALLQRIMTRAASVTDQDVDAYAWQVAGPAAWIYTIPGSLAPQVSSSLGLTSRKGR